MPVGVEIAEALGKGFDKAFGSKIAGIGSDVESKFIRTFLSDESAFKMHPAAEALYQHHQNVYKPAAQKAEATATKAAMAGKPIINASGQAVVEPGAIHAFGKEQAYNTAYGKNGYVIQNVLKKVEADKGKNASDTLADIFHTSFREELPEAAKRSTPYGAPDLRTKFQRDMAKGKDNQGIDIPNSKYKGRAPIEKLAGGFNRFLAYHAAVIHGVTTPLNIWNADGSKALFLTLRDIWGPSSNGQVAQLLASNSISELVLNNYKEDLAFQNSKIAKYAPGSAGQFIHANMHIPGMQASRRMSLIMAAQSGKVGAELAVKKLELGVTKKDFRAMEWAQAALKRLDIDPAKLQAQGFKLHPEDIDKAYYHGANEKAFLDTYESTPSIWRQSPYMRSLKTFTGSISRQGSFLHKDFMRKAQDGDYLGIARSVATLGLVYPLVGSTIQEFDRLTTGEDWDDPVGHMENRLSATPAGQAFASVQGRRDPYNAVATLSNSLEMMARMAAFGGVTGYLRGANRAQLWESFIPPTARIGIQATEDFDKGIHKDSKHPQAWEPFERDLLSDMLPIMGAGSILSHKLVPTRKEQAKSRIPLHPRKPKPKTESDNILNTNTSDLF